MIPALGPLVVGVLFRFRFLVFDGLWFVNFVWVGRAYGFHGELLSPFRGPKHVIITNCCMYKAELY